MQLSCSKPRSPLSEEFFNTLTNHAATNPAPRSKPIQAHLGHEPTTCPIFPPQSLQRIHRSVSSQMVTRVPTPTQYLKTAPDMFQTDRSIIQDRSTRLPVLARTRPIFVSFFVPQTLPLRDLKLLDNAHTSLSDRSFLSTIASQLSCTGPLVNAWAFDASVHT